MTCHPIPTPKLVGSFPLSSHYTAPHVTLLQHLPLCILVCFPDCPPLTRLYKLLRLRILLFIFPSAASGPRNICLLKCWCHKVA
jgi:hypothetical protein